MIASRPVDLLGRITSVCRATHDIKSYFENAMDYKTIDPKDIEVIKVQQIFHRFSSDKFDDFDVYRKYVLGFV